MRVMIQHALAAAIVLLGPGLWLNRAFGRAFWEVGGPKAWALFAVAGTYAVAAAALAWRGRFSPTKARHLILAIVWIITVIAAAILLDLNVSRVAVGLALMVSVLCLILLFWVPGREKIKAGILAITLIVIWSGHVAYAVDYLPRPTAPAVEEFTQLTSLYTLHVRHFPRPVPPPRQSGGALALLWDDYLLATGDGTLYRFSGTDFSDSLDVRPLSLRVPTNPEAFREGVSGLGLTEGYFRVADIHTILDGNTLRLLATHHYWHDDGKCYTVRVSSIELQRDELDSAPADHPWTTLFETTPCLPVELPPDGTPFFQGLEIGGRMASLGTDTLLLTLGDHQFDGVRTPVAFAQDTAVSYGKTYLIDLRTGTVERFTMGHRNPQGLYIDPSGTVWSTEHGPRGGDELNRLVRGGNYGWPIVTYGVNYGATAWPMNPRQGTHEGYDRPVYAWVPSIAVSALTGITGSLFQLWQGDLVAGSLKDRALWRIRLAGENVVLTERIELGVQVRDVLEGHGGELIVWGDPGRHLLVVTPQGHDASTPTAFVQCTGCHEIGDGTKHGLGPDLRGVLGRRIASARGFSYSEALSELEGDWTEETLDAFLSDPAAFAPGTAMLAPGIADPEQRREIIDYLKSLR